MKKILAYIVALSMLAPGTISYAADEAASVDAGITPDSVLYTVDKLFEDLQLAFSPDSENEAGLLLQFANERLAEAKEMTEEEKTEFVQTTINDYMSKLEDAQEKVLEVVTDENMDEEVKEELNDRLDETSEVDEDIEQDLDDEQKEELDEKVENVRFTAHVVKDIDTETVKALREKGLGFGQIAHAALLSEMSGKSVEEIAGMFVDESKGLGEVAKELGIHPSELSGKIKKAVNTDDTEDGVEEAEGGETEEDGIEDESEDDETVADEGESTEDDADEEDAEEEKIAAEVKMIEKVQEKEKDKQKEKLKKVEEAPKLDEAKDEGVKVQAEESRKPEEIVQEKQENLEDSKKQEEKVKQEKSENKQTNEKSEDKSKGNGKKK